MTYELDTEFAIRKPAGLFDKQLYKEFLELKTQSFRGGPIWVFRKVDGKIENVEVGYFGALIVHDEVDGIWSGELAIDWAIKPEFANEALISFGFADGIPASSISVELFFLEREDPSCESNRVIPMWRIKNSEFVLGGTQENSCSFRPSLVLPEEYDRVIEMKIV